MTVSELVERLSTKHPDAEVWVVQFGNQSWPLSAVDLSDDDPLFAFLHIDPDEA